VFPGGFLDIYIRNIARLPITAFNVHLLGCYVEHLRKKDKIRHRLARGIGGEDSLPQEP